MNFLVVSAKKLLHKKKERKKENLERNKNSWRQEEDGREVMEKWLGRKRDEIGRQRVGYEEMIKEREEIEEREREGENEKDSEWLGKIVRD